MLRDSSVKMLTTCCLECRLYSVLEEDLYSLSTSVLESVPQLILVVSALKLLHFTRSKDDIKGLTACLHPPTQPNHNDDEYRSDGKTKHACCSLLHATYPISSLGVTHFVQHMVFSNLTVTLSPKLFKVDPTRISKSPSSAIHRSRFSS